MIKILATSAIIHDNYALRQKEYEVSLSAVNKFGHDLYIVECCRETGPCFLEDFSNNVFYSNVNATLKNKGVNEANALIKAFEYFNFNPKDLIVKITGRYTLLANSFLDEVEDYDCILNPRGDHVFFGCFALRAEMFYQMLCSFNKITMEHDMIGIEYMVARYLEKVTVRKKFVPYIGMACNIANTGVVMI